MNNLHELYKISEELITPLQASVVFLSGKHLHDALRAADELAALNARIAKLEAHMKIYANENNWKSINGFMVLQTLSAPWSDAQAALKGAE